MIILVGPPELPPKLRQPKHFAYSSHRLVAVARAGISPLGWGERRMDRAIRANEAGMMIAFRAALLVVALLVLPAGAQAQSTWPNKPVKILVPTAPGGTADSLARLYGQHLGKVLGQQFYVENRGGAGNVLGIESVVRSPADGYTLLLGAGTITINHLVNKKLPYDVLRDLTPVTQMISVPNVLVVHPAQPMKTLADYVAAAKAAPGKLNYGSAGVGSNLHLAMELLKYRTGIEVTHVPYKGVGPALQDTLAGHVMSMISNVPSSKPHIDKGTLRTLAVTSLKRSPALPNVPTMSEEGVTGYEVLNWFGVFAPAGTPKEIVDRLAAEAAVMFADPKTKEMLTGEGADPIASTPVEFAAFVRAEIKKWDEVGKAANIQPTE
jgi:tripartite-type tricarboxylate transporter receptor subunit TctC